MKKRMTIINIINENIDEYYFKFSIHPLAHDDDFNDGFSIKPEQIVLVKSTYSLRIVAAIE